MRDVGDAHLLLRTKVKRILGRFELADCTAPFHQLLQPRKIVAQRYGVAHVSASNASLFNLVFDGCPRATRFTEAHIAAVA